MPDSLANFFKFQRKWPKNVVRQACKAHSLVLAQPLLRRAPAAENRYAAPQSDDLAPCPSFRGIRPGLLPLLEIKEDRHHLPHVIPVAGIVGLQKELSSRLQGAVQHRQKLGGDAKA